MISRDTAMTLALNVLLAGALFVTMVLLTSAGQPASGREELTILLWLAGVRWIIVLVVLTSCVWRRVVHWPGADRGGQWLALLGVHGAMGALSMLSYWHRMQGGGGVLGTLAPLGYALTPWVMLAYAVYLVNFASADDPGGVAIQRPVGLTLGGLACVGVLASALALRQATAPDGPAGVARPNDAAEDRPRTRGHDRHATAPEEQQSDHGPP